MIQLIRGFKDILPGEVELWQRIESTAVALFRDFGFDEIRIPVMERAELFARSIGEHTDIVEKEMYTFPDRKGDLLTLRPEATASVVRAYIQHGMHARDPVRKLYTIGPMFRRERPQKGRYRQFHQINAEVFGVASARVDAQLVFYLTTLMERLRVEDVAVHLNSLGCPRCRPAFREALLAFLRGRADRLCADCVRRMDKNPLRALDCKVPGCREATEGAPALLDHLGEECRDHFRTLTEALDALDVPYVINPRLVRGLDYYTRTTFEVLTGSLGAQSAVAGGGRYDGLVELLGGPAIPAIGFAVGLDRLAELVGIRAADARSRPDLYIAALGESCQSKAFQWLAELGEAGIRAEMDFEDRSLKSQMKRADRLDARFVLIFGENEEKSGEALLRDMTTKDQETVSVENPVATLRERLA
jgi:histidyl-tRNA synthetase